MSLPKYTLNMRSLPSNPLAYLGQYFQKSTGLDQNPLARGQLANANAVPVFIHYLEERILSINLRLTSQYRHIDNIFMIWPYGEEELENLIAIMNHFNPAIRFTHTANYNQFPF